MWLGVAAAMGTIITAAMRVQESGLCKGYKIQIEGFKKGVLFTSEAHIVELLKTAVRGDIKGQRKTDFNLPLMEDLLEQSSWVYNADLYFDNNDVLHANVTERKPLARVFTSAGTSFYIDEAGKQIPLSETVSLDLPVFTGFPSKKIMNGVDSALVQNVVATASFINSDPFWDAQVAQIDINSCGQDCWNLEMVPVVGNHVVDLGDGSDIASKFHRLYLFYDQVLKRTGFDKYRKIDVQYGGQVIGIKDKITKIDSIQLRKNIESLLQQSRDYNELVQVAPSVDYSSIMQADTFANVNAVIEEMDIAQDSMVAAKDTVAQQKKTEEVKKDAKPPVSRKATATKTVQKKPAKTDTKKASAAPAKRSDSNKKPGAKTQTNTTKKKNKNN